MVIVFISDVILLHHFYLSSICLAAAEKEVAGRQKQRNGDDKYQPFAQEGRFGAGGDVVDGGFVYNSNYHG